MKGDDWKLVVSDNGIGKQADPTKAKQGGLGTAIVQAWPSSSIPGQRRLQGPMAYACR